MPAAQAENSARVLDLGCGTGALLARLVRDDFDALTGADVSARALEIAARRLGGG
jgi:predicted TPR repeat methyltransferase